MLTKGAEHAEHQSTKGDSHHGDHTANFQHEAQNLLGGMVNSVKAATQDLSHIDFSDPFKGAADVVKHAAGAVGHASEAAWKGLDKDKNGHFFKHDICNDNPVFAGVAALTAADAAVVVGILAAPYAIAGASITETAAIGPTVIAALGATGLSMSYDARHPHK